MKYMIYVFIFFTYPLFSYNIGDTLDQKSVQELNMKPDTLYVINFFASWCHACKKELPLISKVYNGKVVKVIGVNVDKMSNRGRDFVAKNNLPFPIVYDTQQILVKLFNPAGIPALYYVKNAKILGMHMGAMKEIDKIITKEVRGL